VDGTVPWLGLAVVIIVGVGAFIGRQRRSRAERRARERFLVTGGADPGPAVVPGRDGSSTTVPPDVVALVEQGRMIQAIKRYRALNDGLGLKEAKDIVDAVAIDHPYSRPTGSRAWTPRLGSDPRIDADQGIAGGLTPEMTSLVLQGKKIQAIKRYRQLNPGVSLKEAKDVIDQIG
jgi:ribosomal protein L7/L12